MTRALAACLVLGACYTAAPPSPPAPAAPPPPRTVPRLADEALCCCTFAFAEPDDFADVAKWDSLATRCATGGGGRMAGQCIAWSFCGYAPGAEPRSLAQRPDLRPPPPLRSDECCCNVAGTSGEDIAVKPRAECDATPNAACIAGDFCGRDDP